MTRKNLRQSQKGTGLVAGGHGIEAPVEGDQIEQIAVLSGRCVGPFAGAVAGQADIEAAARMVEDVADTPPCPLTAAMR